ncbi:MAG: hypothetical protein AB1761_18840 [Pseudomonadota bacterium]
MRRTFKLAAVAVALGLAGCASVPTGPSLQALPGRTKSFEAFQYDDAACRDYALAQIGGRSASDRANEAAAASAVAGTVIGAAAGAAIGGDSGAAGVGAGLGLITGSMIGAGQAQGSYYASQRRYDAAYFQCMYAKGHKVPVYGRYTPAPRRPPPPPPPPPSAAPVYPPADLPPSAYPPPNAPPPR